MRPVDQMKASVHAAPSGARTDSAPEPVPARTREPTAMRPRPHVRGKFLFVGDEKLYLRGVTYGTFEERPDGSQYPDLDVVRRDFAQMSANGCNSVRTYTVPPRWLLDVAQQEGLYVMVGLPWEQHVAFLEDRARRRSIENRVREGVRQCAGHPPGRYSCAPPATTPAGRTRRRRASVDASRRSRGRARRCVPSRLDRRCRRSRRHPARTPVERSPCRHRRRCIRSARGGARRRRRRPQRPTTRFRPTASADGPTRSRRCDHRPGASAAA